MNTTETTLTIGAALPAGAKFIRWDLTNGEEKPANFSDIVEGYHPDNYFRDGKYLGADEAGVEPVFEIPDELSAKIRMSLIVNGSTLPIAQLGPDFLLLRETLNHPSTEASIVMQIDGNERQWTVRLPDGLSEGVNRVRIA